MSISLKNKIDPFILDVIFRLRSAGYETYLVGGAVRDLLLERLPRDYDISTSATPEEIRRIFRDRRTIIIGKRFRLVHLLRGREIIEISTFRKRPEPSNQLDRPKACINAPENMIFQDNSFGTSRDDAFRRDFTINAIFYDPVDDCLVDHTGLGISDLRNGIVRIIGEPKLRLEEDPVRILRAVKLVGQYCFCMEPETGAAVHSSLELIFHSSSARLSLELEKILKNPYAGTILRAFHKFGFLSLYLPEVDRVFRSPQMAYALELLDLRGYRIREGIFRPSLSTAAAMIVLPFAEKEIGKTERGGLWTYYPGIETDLKHLILRMFSPLVLTHRTTSDTMNNLMLQPRFKTLRKLRSFAERKGYPGSRELALIQNMLAWNIPGFEEKCPHPVRSSFASRNAGRDLRRRMEKRLFDKEDAMISDDLTGGENETEIPSVAAENAEKEKSNTENRLLECDPAVIDNEV